MVSGPEAAGSVASTAPGPSRSSGSSVRTSTVTLALGCPVGAADAPDYQLHDPKLSCPTTGAQRLGPGTASQPSRPRAGVQLCQQNLVDVDEVDTRTPRPPMAPTTVRRARACGRCGRSPCRGRPGGPGPPARAHGAGCARRPARRRGCRQCPSRGAAQEPPRACSEPRSTRTQPQRPRPLSQHFFFWVMASPWARRPWPKRLSRRRDGPSSARRPSAAPGRAALVLLPVAGELQDGHDRLGRLRADTQPVLRALRADLDARRVCTGWYRPISSMARPSRRVRESATTMR